MSHAICSLSQIYSVLYAIWNGIQKKVLTQLLVLFYTNIFLHLFYTERQKKLITVFFRATLTKIHAIKLNDIWTQISFNTP